MPSTAGAADRSDFAVTLREIPPNGPFWRYGNVTMRLRSKRGGMQPVVFPHWAHRPRYTCRVCHVELGFGMGPGESGITRQAYVSGKYCGACHDGKRAFGVSDAAKQCERCHLTDTKRLEQRFDKLAETLPMAHFGNGIDWSQALREGLIRPQNALGAEVAMQFPEKLEKPLELKTVSPRSDVTFSHRDHFAEMDCSICHPDIFTIKRKGTENFSMERNIFGSFCGACHMRVAFPMNDCRRCHPLMSSHSGF